MLKTGWRRTVTIAAAVSVLAFSQFFLDSCQRRMDLKKETKTGIVTPIRKEKPVAEAQPAQKDSLTVSIRPIAPAGKKLGKEEVYSKADSDQMKVILSPKARELAMERLNEIDKEDSEWIGKIQIPVRGDRRPPLNPETMDSAAKAGYFELLERVLYKAALAEKTVSEISKCKEDIRMVGRRWKDPEYAEKILARFDKIVTEK